MKTAPCSSGTWPMSPHAPQQTGNSHMPTSTSTAFQITWVSNGKPPSHLHLGRKLPTWVSNGTCDRKSYTYPIKRKPGIWQSSLNGGRSPRMIFAKHRGYTENFCMQCWSSLQGKLTSPTWRPCLPLSIAVHSTHIPHPEAPLTISTGGNTSFVRLSS